MLNINARVKDIPYSATGQILNTKFGMYIPQHLVMYTMDRDFQARQGSLFHELSQAFSSMTGEKKK